MKKILKYLNPIEHLGDRRYSIILPFFLTSATYLFSEFYAYRIAKDPNIVGLYAIYLPFIYIIYTAFRFGIRGGLVTSFLTIIYYFYIIYSRNYSGSQLRSGIQTAAILGIVFVILGAVIGWLKQTIDVLIEQEADEKRRLQAIFQQLPVGIIVTDADGKVTRVNKKISEILGKKIPINTMVGKDTFVEYKKNDKFVSPTQTPLYQVIYGGKNVFEKEYTIKRTDGKIRHINVNASIIQNKTKKTIAAASIVTDITAQKELEERKDDFVNMASHELKTPLTSLKLYIEVLGAGLKGMSDHRAQKALTGIKQQTLRLQDLVNSLLDVSRLQTGKLNFVMEEFRIDILAKDAVDELRPATAGEIKLNKSPLTVFGDKMRIHQVLANLINNAIKYSQSDKAIVVSVKKQKDMALISVQDYGIGIHKDQQKKIFDKLYQVTDPETKTYPGLGMGLYISKEIIKRHHGKLWVESTPGKGSTFYFTIPTNYKKKQ